MLIPVDPQLAAGTLRALARHQGTRVDPSSAEQPGKIPHELRSDVADHGGGLVLPAAYYGTHDATQLWITTLHKAWRWGMPTDEVRALLPALQGALSWMRDYADPGRRRLPRVHRRVRSRPRQPGLEGLQRRSPMARRHPRHRPDRPLRSTGLRVRRRDRRRRVAGRLRAERRRYLARMGREPQRALPQQLLGRRLPGHRPRRLEAPGRRTCVEHGPPPRHRASSTRPRKSQSPRPSPAPNSTAASASERCRRR